MTDNINADTIQRRTWEEWRIQPDLGTVAQFIAKVFANEHQKDPNTRPINQIMGYPIERKRYTGLAIAALLELDAQLQRTTEPEHQDGESWNRYMDSGNAMNNLLRADADPEGKIPPQTRANIIAEAGLPTRIIYLAQLASEAFAEQQSGVRLVMQDAALALQLVNAEANRQEPQPASVPAQPLPPSSPFTPTHTH